MRKNLAEVIDHPSYYGGGDNPYEVIKVMEAWDPLMTYHGCLFSAHCYLARAGKKPGVPVEVDVGKASWYIQRAAEILTRHPDLKDYVQR